MAFRNGLKFVILVWLCSSCFAQLSLDELRQVEYQVDNENNDVDISKEGSSQENETGQNIPKGNEIEEPFKKETKYCLGCAINVPTEQPGVADMVERAVSAMDMLVAAPTIHATPRVLGVQKQVVNGIQYYIQIEVSLSDCPPSTSSPRTQCNPLPESPTLVCEVIFLDQPWNNPKPQLMGNNCTDANSDNDVENYTPDDLLAVERSSGVETSYPMSRNQYEVETSEEKQEATTTAVEDTLTGEVNYENEPRANHGTGMMKAMDTSEIDLINELADIAVCTLNELEVGESHKQVIDIIDAKKQIVNGLMYHLVLRVGSKSCSDESVDCQKQGWTSQSICNVQLHRSWAGDTPYKAKVVNSECEEAFEEEREARQLPSDWVMQEIYDPKYTNCIKAVLAKAYNIVPKDKVTLSGLMRQLKLDSDKWIIPKLNKKEILILRPKVVCNDEPEKSSTKAATNDRLNPADTPEVSEDEFDRLKRSAELERPTVFGGVNAADKNSDGVKEAATFAVGELSKRESANSKLVLVDLVDAKQQVVAGISYHLTLKVSESSCGKGDASADCQPLPDGKREVCTLKVWSKPWLSELTLNDVDCKVQPTKRAAEDVVGGGLSDADKNSPGVRAAVDFAVQELDKSSNSGYTKKAFEVIEAKQQVVAGLLYHLKIRVTNCKKDGVTSGTCEQPPNTSDEICSVKVWSRPWLNSTEVTEVKCSPARSRRSVGSVRGGIVDAENNDALKEAIAFAVGKLDEGTNSIYKQKVVEVVDAKRQTVAGTLYHLTLKLGESTCRKSDQGEAGDCELLPNTEVRSCSLKVWTRPWLNEISLTESNCSPVRSRRSLGEEVPVLGGVGSADRNSDGVRDAATFAVGELSKRESANSELVLVDLVDAKQQVVQGISYHLTLKVSESSCSKGDASANCQALPDGKRELCTLKVWSKPWLNEKSVHDVECKVQPTKRSPQNIPGGLRDSDKNSAEVRAAVDFAIQELDKTSNSGYKKKAAEIIEAKQQVVAGVLYHLKIRVSNCKKNDQSSATCEQVPGASDEVCTLKVWSRPWLNAMEVSEVQCNPVRTRRPVRFGGEKKVEDLQDPYINEIAEYSRNEIDKATNSMFTQKVVRVIEARKKVVSGILVTIKLELIRTGCTKTTKDRSNCEALPDQKSQICEVSVWDRPWLNVRKIRDVKCADAHIISTNEQPADTAENLFSTFIDQFNKTYESDLEKERRFEIFKENLNTIKELQDTERGTATYGPTMFADLTHEEFKKNYLGLRPDLRQENYLPFPQAEIPNIELPKEFDWRDKNAVTPVKNQGMCGSCWAFSVTGDIEGQYAIKYKKLLSFSEQELVDCDKLDDGCQGGLPDNAYRALEQLGGLESEEDYPYDGRGGEACSLNKTLTRVQVHGALNISTNETEMAKWLVQNGPISIGINANAMQFYMGGVSHPLKFLCSPGSLDHGVLIVGFGEHRTRYRKKLLPYWLVKNSWGKFWGEQGYYRVYRGDGSCGVNMMASSAIIE